MDQQLKQTIVHWKFDADDWQQFLDFDKQKRQKQDVAQAFIILILIAVILVVFLFLGPVEAFIALIIVGGIIALGVVAHFVIQDRRHKHMQSAGLAGSGEVYITPNGINMNGIWFDWGDGTPWRLTTVTPVLADMGVGLAAGEPNYIEFKCVGRAAGRHRAPVDKKWRVPVPQGKEDEARDVIKYFGKPSAMRDEFGLPDD